MAVSDSQKQASLKWDKENMFVLGCKVKRYQASAFKSYCEEKGQSPNAVLKDYVFCCIGEKKTAQRATDGPVAAPSGVCGILPPATLEAAQMAAEATGEDASQFLARAVETQAKRDEASLLLGVNPAAKERAGD